MHQHLFTSLDDVEEAVGPTPAPRGRRRKKNIPDTNDDKAELSSPLNKAEPIESDEEHNPIVSEEEQQYTISEEEKHPLSSSDEVSTKTSDVSRRRRPRSVSANTSEDSQGSPSVSSDQPVVVDDAKLLSTERSEQPEVLTKPSATKRSRRSASAARAQREWPQYGSHAELVEDALAMRGDPLEADGGRVVLFRGSTQADLVVIGEGPGAEEDRQGLPFVGESGQLLDRIFRYAGFYPEQHLYVTNAVKRRPKNNRDPLTGEVAYYHGLLREELRLVDPKIVIIAGRIALKAMLPDAPGISRIRGKWFQLGDAIAMPIFHPSFILRFPSKKGLMRDDVLEIRRKYLELVPDAELADVSNQGSTGRQG